MGLLLLSVCLCCLSLSLALEIADGWVYNLRHYSMSAVGVAAIWFLRFIACWDVILQICSRSFRSNEEEEVDGIQVSTVCQFSLRANNIQDRLRTLHKSREANKLAIRVSLLLQMLSKFPHKSQGHFCCIQLHQQSAAASSSSLATINAPAATSPKSPKSPTR